MSITISICDDDEAQISQLRTLLAAWASDKPFVLHIEEYVSAEGFLFSYPDHLCDLLLLDIEMRGQSGMALAKQLRAEGDVLPIVFITGYSEYMGDGYDVEALHYLLKPLQPEKLFAVLDRYIQHRSNSSAILLPCSDRTIRIATEAIVFCEAYGKQTFVQLSDGSDLICTCGISKLAKQLGNGFIACHRSYLVHLRFVRSISKTVVMLDSGKELPLSRRMYEKVNQAFISYYTKPQMTETGKDSVS